MVVPVIAILVVTDEPGHAAYLRAVLQLELPGRFEVWHAGRGLPPPRSADLVLLLGEPGERGSLDELHRFAGEGRPPVIVVASSHLGLEALGSLIADGAEDVIDLARLTARGLAAAVLKAVRRHGRVPRYEHVAAPWPSEGVLAMG